jgi:flagellar protein FliO/FliZ
MILSRLHAVSAAAITCCLLAVPPAALAAVPEKTANRYGEDTALNLPNQNAEQLQAASGGSGGSLVRTFVGLAVVVAVIYGLYWILRQVKSGREDRSVGTGLATAASVSLGPNRSLHLVRAGRELVLVGVADHAVTPIRTYTEEEARAAGLVVEEPAEGDDDATGGPAIFAEKKGLRSLRGMTIGTALERIRQATVRA